MAKMPLQPYVHMIYSVFMHNSDVIKTLNLGFIKNGKTLLEDGEELWSNDIWKILSKS